MAVIGNVITTAGCTAAVLGVVNSTVNDDGEVDRDKRNAMLATTVSVGATTTIGSITGDMAFQKELEKISTSYVDSLSDEELAYMLDELNLMEHEAQQEKEVKTI